MTIALAFTVTAALALIGLLWIERELVLNWYVIKLGRRNGMSLEVSWMLVVLITVISTTNALLLVIGIGALFKAREIGYLLAVIPVIKLAGALLVMRSLRKQVGIYRKQAGLR